MDLKKYASTLHGLKTEAYFSRMVTTGLLCLVFYLGSTLASRPMIVTIHPWTLTEEAQVTRATPRCPTSKPGALRWPN